MMIAAQLTPTRRAGVPANGKPFGNGTAVFLALAVTHGDVTVVKIQIVHPQAQTLEQAQIAAIEQLRLQPADTVQLRQPAAHIVAVQHRGQPFRACGAGRLNTLVSRLAQHPGRENEQGMQRLVLG